MSITSIFKAVLPIVVVVATGGAAAPLVAAQQMALRAAIQIAIQKIGQELGLPPAIINMAQMMAASQMGGTQLNDFSAVGGAQSYINQAISEFSMQDQGSISRAFDSVVSGARDLSSGLQNQSAGYRANSDAAVAQYDAAKERGASDKALDRLMARVDSTQQQMNNFDEFLTSTNLSNARRKGRTDIEGVMKGKGSLLMKIAILLGMIADQKMADMATKAEQIGKMGEIKGKNQAKFTQLNAELQALGQELGTISQATANVIKSIGEAGQALARKG
jgi:hypothetical protein